MFKSYFNPKMKINAPHIMDVDEESKRKKIKIFLSF